MEIFKSLRTGYLLMPALVRAALLAFCVLSVAGAGLHVWTTHPPAAPVAEPKAAAEPKPEPGPAPVQAPGSALTMPAPYSYDWGSQEWSEFCQAPSRCRSLSSPDGGLVVWGDSARNSLPTRDASQPENRGLADVFVARFDAKNKPVFATYLGGSMNDTADAALFDKAGNLWIAGGTDSQDFPAKEAWQTSFTGAQRNCFMAKFDPAGRLLLSSYLNGPENCRVVRLWESELEGRHVAALLQSPDGRSAVSFFGAQSGTWQYPLGRSGLGKDAEWLPAEWLFFCGSERSECKTSPFEGGHYIFGSSALRHLAPAAKSLDLKNHGRRNGFIGYVTGGKTLFATFLGGRGNDRVILLRPDSGGTGAYLLGLVGSSSLAVKGRSVPGCGGNADLLFARLDPKAGRFSFLSCLAGGGKGDAGAYLTYSLRVNMIGEAEYRVVAGRHPKARSLIVRFDRDGRSTSPSAPPASTAPGRAP